MPISEVTMYRGTCDVCGRENDGDWWARADRHTVVNDWNDSDGVALSDGRLFHEDCCPDGICRRSEDGDGLHDFEDGECVNCGRPSSTVSQQGDEQ
jgi:hypothetical protein